MSVASELVNYCFHRVIIFLLYRFNAKSVNDVIYMFTKEDMKNMSLVIF